VRQGSSSSLDLMRDLGRGPEAAASFMWALGSNLMSRPEAVQKQRALRRQYLLRSHSSARIWRVRSGKLRPGTDVTSSWTGHTAARRAIPGYVLSTASLGVMRKARRTRAVPLIWAALDRVQADRRPCTSIVRTWSRVLPDSQQKCRGLLCLVIAGRRSLFW
jgi:hypothetical protein